MRVTKENIEQYTAEKLTELELHLVQQLLVQLEYYMEYYGYSRNANGDSVEPNKHRCLERIQAIKTDKQQCIVRILIIFSCFYTNLTFFELQVFQEDLLSSFDYDFLDVVYRTLAKDYEQGSDTRNAWTTERAIIVMLMRMFS